MLSRPARAFFPPSVGFLGTAAVPVSSLGRYERTPFLGENWADPTRQSIVDKGAARVSFGLGWTYGYLGAAEEGD